MARGNINRKYLRRRKSWVQRNIGLLIFIFVMVVLVVMLAVGAVLLVRKFIGNNENNAVVEDVTEATRQVVWIDSKENIVKKNEVIYTPPANVKLPYFIKVNRELCCVTVYGIDAEGKYTIPVKAFACSIGKEGQETIVGENFTVSDKYEWRLMVDNTYGMYACRFYGSYLFHSVPYLTTTHGSLEPGEYNKLGSPASLGCVRLCVRDVKWIYDNCPQGTKVTVYDDATTPGPLGKPELIKIPEGSANAGWDPTDPDPMNPWLKSKAEIKGAKDITVKVGEKTDIMNSVKATDTCGNDITKDIQVVGRYTFDQAGDYSIKYVVTDLLDSRAEVSIMLHVVQ